MGIITSHRTRFAVEILKNTIFYIALGYSLLTVVSLANNPIGDWARSARTDGVWALVWSYFDGFFLYLIWTMFCEAADQWAIDRAKTKAK